VSEAALPKTSRDVEGVDVGRVARWLVVLPLVLFLPTLARTVLVETFEIDGPSMAPTLRHGDRFLVHTIVVHLAKRPPKPEPETF